ncbi:MAG: hypothetical protein E6G94_04520 [Alphaproteobacteria bacterium]|nr:MAG: hypothetical protein E6G94_04520 [Alphaproteobacteria bacterium]
MRGTGKDRSERAAPGKRKRSARQFVGVDLSGHDTYSGPAQYEQDIPPAERPGRTGARDVGEE